MADALQALNGATRAATDLVTAAGATSKDNINQQAGIAADANAALALSNIDILQQQTNLQRTQANNADLLDKTRVSMDQQYAANALTSLQTSLAATQNTFGVAQTLASSVVKMTAEKAKLEDNKPSFFKNPLGWLVDSVKISKLEDDIATRTGDATNAFNQASAISASAAHQFADLTAIHKLQTSVALDAQATMQNQGLRETQASIEGAAKQNAVLAAAIDKQYAIAKDVRDFHIREISANAEMAKAKAAKVTADTLAEQKKQRDDSIEQMTQFMSKTRGVPITPVLRNAAADYYDALGTTPEGKAQRAALLDLNMRTVQYADKNSMTNGILNSGSVADVRLAGTLMQDSVLAQLGSNEIIKRSQEIYASSLATGFKLATGKDAISHKTEFNTWMKSLPKDQKDKYTADANQMATQEILQKPVADFARDNLAVAGNAIPLNPTTWSNADYLEKTYGISKDSKASKVMTNPAVQLQVQASANSTGPDTAVDSVYALHKNFMSNGLTSLQENAKLIADIYKRNAAAESYGGSNNPIYSYMKSKGLATTPSARVTYDGKAYDLTLSSDVENLLVRKDKNVNDTLGNKFKSVIDFGVSAASSVGLDPNVNAMLTSTANAVLQAATLPTITTDASGRNISPSYLEAQKAKAAQEAARAEYLDKANKTNPNGVRVYNPDTKKWEPWFGPITKDMQTRPL